MHTIRNAASPTFPDLSYPTMEADQEYDVRRSMVSSSIVRLRLEEPDDLGWYVRCLGRIHLTNDCRKGKN